MYGDLHEEVKPLSKAEIKWVIRLEKVLKACPTNRIELFTIGDSDLTVIDGKVMRKYDYDIHDGNADKNGLVLGHVIGKPSVHAVSG